MTHRLEILGTGTAIGTTAVVTTQTGVHESVRVDLMNVVYHIPWTNLDLSVGGGIAMFGTVATTCFLVRMFFKGKG